MTEPDSADTLRAAANIMRATAGRMEATLAERSVSEEQLVERVRADNRGLPSGHGDSRPRVVAGD